MRGMEIVNIVESLPRHPTIRYKSRSDQSITTIVLHHTAGKETTGQATVDTLRGYAKNHIQQHGWPGIGYHYAIGADGVIYKCNKTTSISYHAKGGNTRGLGIALMGNFVGQKPSDAALESLKYLCKVLKLALPNIKEVKAHREIPGSATACPGDVFMQWIRLARQQGEI